MAARLQITEIKRATGHFLWQEREKKIAQVFFRNVIDQITVQMCPPYCFDYFGGQKFDFTSSSSITLRKGLFCAQKLLLGPRASTIIIRSTLETFYGASSMFLLFQHQQNEGWVFESHFSQIIDIEVSLAKNWWMSGRIVIKCSTFCSWQAMHFTKIDGDYIAFLQILAGECTPWWIYILATWLWLMSSSRFFAFHFNSRRLFSIDGICRLSCASYAHFCR